MDGFPLPVRKVSTDKRIALWPWLLAAAAWTALIAGSVVVAMRDEAEQTRDFALIEARASLEKDLLYRRWASGHGGVYVQPTEKSPPNPYLAFMPGRDVVTTDGKKLTLVNPAYMTRQVHELSAEQYGTKGHITSVKPIRPENFPDQWEARALAEFERGAKEKWEITEMAGVPHLRFMRVLYAEKGCLRCHEKQGYKEGEVRGGLSTSVPLDHFAAISEAESQRTILLNSAIWLVGMIALFFMRRQVLAGTAELSASLAETEASKARYQSLFDNMLEAFALCELVTDKDGKPGDYRFLAVNPAFTRLFGHSQEKMVGNAASEIGCPVCNALFPRLAEVGLSGVPATFDGWFEELQKHLELYIFRPNERVVAFVARDLTARKAAEAERELLATQLQQSQKMEAIGKLAGGVAHDFNNMLGVILGNSELTLLDMAKNDPLREHIDEIVAAATRSSEITRQLLAFARKQTIAPKIVGINDHVGAMLKMIRRLIGEDINLTWKPGGDIWKIKIDPGQLDQILANLATNARDAITGVGQLMIETANAVITEEYARTHAGFLPGSYAVLTVSDDGCGIDREKLSAIFEPFFTTKGKGKGTGLGLATVYGIVKQNGGFINVYSEPGHGATFRIYFKAVEAEEAVEADSADEPLKTGTETVLLVEDEAAILKLTTKYLAALGYTVLGASGVEEALSLALANREKIALVLTDVVMPDMNGRDLCEKLRELIPNLKCLYMSGYTANVIAHRGVLDEGVNFISKPFGMGELGKKIRSVLDT